MTNDQVEDEGMGFFVTLAMGAGAVLFGAYTIRNAERTDIKARSKSDRPFIPARGRGALLVIVGVFAISLSVMAITCGDRCTAG